jgi:hypothetical protein
MHAQETTLFECPCIEDGLNARNRSGHMKWTLDRLRTVIDSCSNPPQFRGVKTPITELLEQEVMKAAPTKVPNPQQEKDKTKLHSHATEKTPRTDPNNLTKRPAHKLPSSLLAGLKRPDLTAIVDGKLIASNFQRQLFDDIKHGNCVRCHSKEHARATCKEPVGRWEAKFDENKNKYWLGTLKWQKKSQEENPALPPRLHPPPTLVQKKKESRRYHLVPQYR